LSLPRIESRFFGGPVCRLVTIVTELPLPMPRIAKPNLPLKKTVLLDVTPFRLISADVSNAYASDILRVI